MILSELPAPSGINKLSNRDILVGDIISPIDRLKIIDEDTYEDMILEWLTSFRNKYKRMMRLGGSGDKGIDVIAYLDREKKSPHFFQCKHYNRPLAPSDIYLELGKLCYYTFEDKIEVPLKYYFVAPQGIGPTLKDLLGNKKELKSKFLANWEDKCKNQITSKHTIELDQKLKEHIDNFNFDILDHVEPIEFIEDFKKTGYYPSRFGGGLQKKRDFSKIAKPTENVDIREINYVGNIYLAYSEYLKINVQSQKDFASNEHIKNHFIRQRTNFYHAESLEQFSRDALPFGNTSFSDLKDEIYEHVIEVCESEDYEHGFARLNETIKMAKTSAYTSSPLTSELKANDKSGICHHLSNENRLKWTK